MRLLLAVALTLLFLWLQKAEDTDEKVHRNPCQEVSSSEAVVSLLLSPLSLYSWLTSTLLRLVLSVPALILSSLYHSLLLLLAGPWCVISICVSLLLIGLQVALYLLHLALVIGVGVILVFVQFRKTNSDTTKEKMLQQKKKVDSSRTKSKLRFFGRGGAQQG